MTPEHMGEYVEAINGSARARSGLRGQPLRVGAVRRDSGLNVRSPAGIMTSAESIYPEQRALIARVFRAPVFDRYGSREAGNMAWECDHHRGLHVPPPRI